MKNEPSKSFVETLVQDEGVRRACADVVIAIVDAFTGKRGVATTSED